MFVALAADGSHTINMKKPTLKTERDIYDITSDLYSLTYNVFKDQVLKAPLQGEFIVGKK